MKGFERTRHPFLIGPHVSCCRLDTFVAKNLLQVAEVSTVGVGIRRPCVPEVMRSDTLGASAAIGDAHGPLNGLGVAMPPDSAMPARIVTRLNLREQPEPPPLKGCLRILFRVKVRQFNGNSFENGPSMDDLGGLYLLSEAGNQ